MCVQNFASQQKLPMFSLRKNYIFFCTLNSAVKTPSWKCKPKLTVGYPNEPTRTTAVKKIHTDNCCGETDSNPHTLLVGGEIGTAECTKNSFIRLLDMYSHKHTDKVTKWHEVEC